MSRVLTILCLYGAAEPL